MSAGTDEPFEADAAIAPPELDLVLDLGAYEGPIDVLLALAREQKVDLTKISILQLADQYLAFIAGARHLRLEIAADYLVMAAWLAYLKSRLLLPEPQPDDEPSGAELAAALSFQLQRLEAMQQAGLRLMAGPLLGRDTFGRGAPEGLSVVARVRWDASLYDLLKAYGEGRARTEVGVLEIRATEFYSMDDALERLVSMVGRVPDWRVLASFLPDGLSGGILARSALAATFAATLELARTGQIQLRQDATFGPLYLRSAGAPDG